MGPDGVEGILAIIFLFGGGTLYLLAISPVGKAIAQRIRYGKQLPEAASSDPAVWEEIDRLRVEMSELQERVDFAERLLAKGDSNDARGVVP